MSVMKRFFVGKITKNGVLTILIISLLGGICPIMSSSTWAIGRSDSIRNELLSFAGAANRFSLMNPQEKVYLHFDNTGYYMGETIWFTAYVVNGLLNRATDMSKVLYVELLSPEGRVLEQQKLKIEQGRASGSISLSGSSKVVVGGFYEVRAYTHSMLNWEGTYYTRVFPVFDNPSERGEYRQRITLYPRSERFPYLRPREEKLKKLNVTFYPEGGYLIAGLPTIVSYKAYDEKGLGVTVSGGIYDKSGDRVADIESVHLGMGRFEFTPERRKYEARITYGGKEYRYPLPEVQTKGYALHIDNSWEDSVEVRLSRSSETSGGELGVVVLCRGLAYEFGEIDLRSNEAGVLRLSKQNLPGGVQQVVVYNREGSVVCDRLFYHDDGRRVNIAIDGVKSVYRPFERIRLGVQATDEQGVPVQARLSVGIFDSQTAVASYDRRDIASELLLGSEVRGYIEDIDYYFESPGDEERRQHLDLLLSVQGWRRYEWRELTGEEDFTAEYPVEDGITVSGKVLGSFLSKAKRGVDITVWVYSSETNVKGKSRTDSLGRFRFVSSEDIYGENDMSILTEEKRRRGKTKAVTHQVILDRTYRPEARAYGPTDREVPEFEYRGGETSTREVVDSIREVEIDSLLQMGLPAGTRVHQLPEVEVSRRWWERFEYRRGIQYDVPEEEDRLIDNRVDYTNSLADFLTKIDPNFRATGYGLYYKAKPVKIVTYQDMYYATLDDIDSIRIAESFDPAILMSYEWDRNTGARAPVEYRDNNTYIIVFPKPVSKQEKGKTGYRKTKLRGYSVPTDFYRVDYSKGVLPDEQDYRRTLYWNPSVETDSSGRASVIFYNNSTEHGLGISVETLSPDGVPGVYRP